MNTKQTEALKLALEALEEFGEHHDMCPRYPTYAEPENYPPCNCGFEKAITAIREAMAEQPAQQQEPVAYMVKAHGMLQRISRRADVADEIACQYRKDDPNAEVLPLYTTPPQRKPLTDEQLQEIADKCRLYPRDFARAIEAAHGIKENT